MLSHHDHHAFLSLSLSLSPTIRSTPFCGLLIDRYLDTRTTKSKKDKQI
jgi:hypothetical protein